VKDKRKRAGSWKEELEGQLNGEHFGAVLGKSRKKKSLKIAKKGKQNEEYNITTIRRPY